MPDDLEWIEFDPEGAPSVLTADLCEASGGCEKCPGFTNVGSVQPDHPDPDATVFCMHWCHRVAPEI